MAWSPYFGPKLRAAEDQRQSAPQANRLFLILILLGLAGLTVAGRFYYRSYRQALFEQAYQYSVPALNRVSGALAAKLKGYEDLSLQFLSNKDLNQALQRYTESPDTYDVSQYNRAFSNFLEGYAFNDQCLYDGLFLDESDESRKTLTMGEALPNNFIRSFRQSAEFRRIVAADGRPVWFDLRISGVDEHTLALGRRIKHVFSGRPLGVLVLFVSEEHLDYFINADLYDDDRFSRHRIGADYYLLVGPDRTVLSTPIKEDLGKSLAGVTGARVRLRSNPSGRGATGHFFHGVGEGQILVTYQAVNPAGLYLFNIIERSVAARINRGVMSDIHNPSPALVLIGALLAVAFVVLLRRPVRLGRPKADTPAAVAVPPVPAWLSDLTNRERDILILLAQGLDNKQIAQRLFMAEQTVKNYVSVIYGKMDVHDRVQASLKAIEAGLADPARK